MHPRVPLRGEGSCGGGGAPRDSAGSGATEEGLTSRGGMQSPSVVILEPRKIKSATVSTVSPSILHEVMGLDAMIFVF